MATDQADARALLASVKLPPGTTATSTNAEDSAFSAHTTDCDESVDVSGSYGFWSTPESLDSLIDYERANPPAGSTVESDPYDFDEAGESVSFLFPAVSGVSLSRRLTVEGVQLPDGGTALDVFTGVFWENARPASEQVPGDASSVTISSQEYRSGSGGDTQSVTVTDPGRVSQIIAATNALTAQSPPGDGSPPACPTATDIQATFNDANGDQLAESTASPVVFPCGDTGFSLGGQPRYPLSSSTGSGAETYFQYLQSILQTGTT